MNRKKKINLVVILPALLTLGVVSGLFVLVLVAGTGRAHSESSASPSSAVELLDKTEEAVVPPGQADGGLPGAVVSSPDGVTQDDSPGYAGGSRGQEGTGGYVLPPDGPLPPEMKPQACDFKQWIGTPVDEASVKATGRPYRILNANSMITEDYSPSRINVVVDGNNIVTEVHCG